MTGMLASVRDCREAETVFLAGADIIDLKEPRRGALGAVETGEIVRVVEWVSGRRLTSAVCGDLPMDAELVAGRVREIAETGVDFIKIGFTPSQRMEACVRRLGDIAGSRKLIAVLFADHVYPGEPLALFAAAGFHGVMIDTADKSKGHLLHHLPPERAGAFVEACRMRKLMAGLAGSLEAPDIPRLLGYNPDFLGFRSALCDEGRHMPVSREKTAGIRALIPEELPARSVAKVDYRLLAARGYFPEAGKITELGTDRIFVSEFILPVHIGAYSFEHGQPQKVRFDVSADVLRVTRNPEDMRHVVSYDLIMDAIRAIVARGHIELVETLAEQIAAMLLENPRIAHVVVRVEKLELGAGGVGVIIERQRQQASRRRPLPGPAIPGKLKERHS